MKRMGSDQQRNLTTDAQRPRPLWLDGRNYINPLIRSHTVTVAQPRWEESCASIMAVKDGGGCSLLEVKE